MCGLHHRFAPLRSRTLRRIPQVVSTVATRKYRHLRKRLRGGVSIPQAVSTVATLLALLKVEQLPYHRFNTASGKHCCN